MAKREITVYDPREKEKNPIERKRKEKRLKKNAKIRRRLSGKRK